MLQCAQEEKENTNQLTAYGHPVYKQLSMLNGEINRMAKDELTYKLKELHLSSRGTTDVLKKRLKSYYKIQKLEGGKVRSRHCFYDYLCVIDFEATCHSQKPCIGYMHEIIEFPAVLIDVENRKIVSEFHEYCRPVYNPILTEFCHSLTGISQETVDKADLFPEVFKRFEDWLKSNTAGYRFCIVTDGPWDMGRFLSLQCFISKISYPSFCKKWVNLRKSFGNFYKAKRVNLSSMLESLGLAFEGRPHSGLDDTKNVARIVIHMLNDRANFRANERIRWNSLVKDGISEEAVAPITRVEFLHGQSSSESENEAEQSEKT